MCQAHSMQCKCEKLTSHNLDVVTIIMPFLQSQTEAQKDKVINMNTTEG